MFVVGVPGLPPGRRTRRPRTTGVGARWGLLGVKRVDWDRQTARVLRQGGGVGVGKDGGNGVVVAGGS